MGDRGNVTLHYGKAGNVNVYVHWAASDLPELVREALARRERWDDDTYLARIIVSTIVKHVGIDDETGMGIAPTNMFGEAGPVIDLEKQTVTLRGHFGGDDTPQWIADGIVPGTYSFEEYLALPWEES